MESFIRRLIESTPAWPFTVFRAVSAIIAILWVALRPGSALDARSLATCGLAAAMALSGWPRLCAAGLFALASGSSDLRSHAASLDDYCVVLLMFWCVLLPAGPRLSALLRSEARALRVEGASRRACLLSFALLYLNVGAWTSYPPFESASRAPAVLLAVVPALLMLSVGARWRRLVVALQLALHVGLWVGTGALFTQLALAATALLVSGAFWSADAPAATTEPEPQLGTASALAVTYASIALLVISAQLLGQQSIIDKSRKLFDDVGLPVRYVLLGPDSDP